MPLITQEYIDDILLEFIKINRSADIATDAEIAKAMNELSSFALKLHSKLNKAFNFDKPNRTQIQATKEAHHVFSFCYKIRNSRYPTKSTYYKQAVDACVELVKLLGDLYMDDKNKDWLKQRDELESYMRRI